MPQIIGFFAGVLVPLFAQPKGAAPGDTAATMKYIFGFNALVYAAALSAAPFGVRLLIRESRAWSAKSPAWLELGATLLTSALVILAWVVGVRRFLQGSHPVPLHELSVALVAVEAATLFAISLLARFIASMPKARTTRTLALAAMILATVHLMFILLPGVLGDVAAGAVNALIGLIKWTVVFSLLWSTRGLTHLAAESPPYLPQPDEH